MLDFSYDLNIGLFFAFDNCGSVKGDNDTENYVSLYFYDRRYYITQIANLIDMLASSLGQAVKMLEDFKKNYNFGVDDSILRDITKLSAWKKPDNAGDGLCKINIGLLDNSVAGNQVTDILGNRLFWTPCSVKT